MIVELDGGEPAVHAAARRVPVALVYAIGIAVALALLAAALTPPPSGAVLTLPSGLADVQLSAMADRLANEPPLARIREPISIRGTMGLASVEGPAAVTWTERGIAYQLSSPRLAVAELIRLADGLR